jgi:hypothetical protein
MRRCCSRLPEELSHVEALFAAALCVAELAGMPGSAPFVHLIRSIVSMCATRSQEASTSCHKRQRSMALCIRSTCHAVSCSAAAADWKLVNSESAAAAELCMLSAKLLDDLLTEVVPEGSAAAQAAQADAARSVGAELPSASSSSESLMFDIPLDAHATVDSVLAGQTASSESRASRGQSSGATLGPPAQRASLGGTGSAAAPAEASADAQSGGPECEALQKLLDRVHADDAELCTAAFQRLQAMLSHAAQLAKEAESLQVLLLNVTCFSYPRCSRTPVCSRRRGTTMDCNQSVAQGSAR